MTNLSSTEDDLFNIDLIRSYVDKEVNPRFVERHWLKQQVENKLADLDCRFLLLTAEPGAGKSAFMAWLAEQHPDWCRYFIRRDQRTPLGDVGTHSFLLQIGFQLAAIYPGLFNQKQIKITVRQRIGKANANSETVGAEIEEIIASPFYQKIIEIQQQVRENQGQIAGVRIGKWYADNRSITLSNLQYMALFEPATSILKRKQKGQIVILVDALDEMSYHDSQENLVTWLANCPKLPSNLRFVLTSRPDDRLLRVFRDSQKSFICEMTIDADDQNVKDDLSTYTRSLVEINNVQVALKTINQELETFVHQAVEQANGNFGYLDAIGRTIDQVIAEKDEQYLIELLNLSSLPKTLEGLYGFFLTRIHTIVKEKSIYVKDPKTMETHYIEVWGGIYRPVLGVLAVACEPLSKEQIQKFASIPDDCWGDLIDAIERLCQFLDKLGNDKLDKRYRLYHSTFPEFLTSPKTKQTDYSFCYVDAIKQNQNIVDYYRAEAKSWDEVDWQKKDINNYGLLYLAVHLYSAELKENLYALLTDSPKWMEEKFKAFNGHAAYVNDLELAINDNNFAGSLQRKQLLTLVKLYTARQIVYQSVSIYDDTDLKTLARLGRKAEALSHATLRSDPKSKFESLLAIHYTLQEKEQLDLNILNEAEKVSDRIIKNSDRAKALCKLAISLAKADCANKANQVFTQARKVADKISDNTEQTEVLTGLATSLAQTGRNDQAEEVFTKTREVADTIEMPSAKIWVLQNLGIALIKIRRVKEATEVLTKAEEIAGAIGNYSTSPEILTELAVALFQAGFDEKANKVFTQAQKAAYTYIDGYQDIVLRELAIALVKTGRNEKADEVFTKAQEVTNSIQDDIKRIKALSKLAITLVNGKRVDKSMDVFREAIESVEDIHIDKNLIQVLSQLAAVLAQSGYADEADEVFNTVEDVIERIQDNNQQVYSLKALATALTQAQHFKKAGKIFTKAEKIEGKVENNFTQTLVLSKLATVLVQTRRTEEAIAILTKAKNIADEIKDYWEQGRALTQLALALVQVKQTEEVSKVFAKSRKVASKIEDPYEQTWVLRELAVALAKTERTKEARKVFTQAEVVANNIEDDAKKAEELKELTVALVEAGEFNKAETVAEKIENYYEQVEALSQLAVALAHINEFTKAERVASKIKNKQYQVWVLSELAAKLYTNNRKKARKNFIKASKIADKIDDSFEQVCALTNLAAAFALIEEEDKASNYFDRAKGIVDRIDGDIYKAHALEYLAAKLAQFGKDESKLSEVLIEAKKVISKIKHDWERVKLLKSLAPKFAQLKHFKEAFDSCFPKGLNTTEIKEKPSQILDTLFESRIACETDESELCLDILKQVIQVLAWVNLDWCDIDKLLHF